MAASWKFTVSTMAYYNIEGLGIRFVASPRHADMLLVTGPVSRHMEIALKRTYDATPDPSWWSPSATVAAMGGFLARAMRGCGKIANVIPVDVASVRLPAHPYPQYCKGY